jgi:hypothetical protein
VRCADGRPFRVVEINSLCVVDIAFEKSPADVEVAGAARRIRRRVARLGEQSKTRAEESAAKNNIFFHLSGPNPVNDI